MGQTTLIVLAHPERGSFCGAWAEASAAAAEGQGDRVLWSDLYGMGFHPAEGPGRYDAPLSPFDALKAQELATASGHLPTGILAEAEKIRAADRIVFHFPMWWFAPPAMLKGWCDRALVHGLLHDVDRRFDTGLLRGKRALMPFSAAADFDAEGRLRRDAPSHWPFIRHEG